MHPKVAEAIQQIDAAVFNGDTFEEPEARAELLEYIERWCQQLAQPYHGTKPPVFEEEWALKEAAGYRYGDDALENVAFGFRIAKEAYERGYTGEDEPKVADPQQVLAVRGEREFYELMQAYRHSPHTPQKDVVAAYEAVKAYVRKHKHKLEF